MNKTRAIQLHLIERGNITSWEAIQEYGATRLSAIIYELRHRYKMNIKSYSVEFTDRYGSKASFARYVLEESE